MIKIGVFSGRFSPPNLGHIMTIERLIEEYHFLLVPILDYPERTGCTVEQAKAIFEHHFSMVIPKMFRNRVEFIVNKVHFGKITPNQYLDLLRENGLDSKNCVTYLAGNEEVLSHMQDMGFKCEFVPRVVVEGIDQYLFESTRIRKQMVEENKSLSEVYNLEISC